MTPLDRAVRARIYRLFADGNQVVDVESVAASGGWGADVVAASFTNLAADHRIALTPDGQQVWMAHPFSGVPTSYEARIGDRVWQANCAWDALAILSILGDGEAHCENGLTWSVSAGKVSPDGIVHLLVPARSFWDDIGFT